MKLKVLTFSLLIVLSIINGLCNCSSFLFSFISSILLILLYGFIIIKGRLNLKSKKYIIIFILLSICFCTFSYQNFILNYKDSAITIKNISDSPILIDAIYVDGKKIKIDKLYEKKYDKINNASFITEYKIQNKNTKDYKATLRQNDKYVFNVKNKSKIEIEIQKKSTKFSVSINDKIAVVDKFDYSIPEKAIKMANYNYVYKINNKYINYKSIANWVIIFLLFIFNFNMINLSFHNRKLQLLFMLFSILEFNPINKINVITRIFLYLLLFLMLKKSKGVVFTDKKYNIGLFLGSLYISFSFLGKYILDSLNIINLVYYIVVVMFFYYLFPIIFEIIDNIIKKNRKTISKGKIIYHRIIVFCITFGVIYLYKIMFYPYIYLTDSIMQTTDIKNNILSNWHPYLHTLLLKLFYSISNDFNLFIIFRIIIYSLLLNKILFYFHNKGMKLTYIYIFTIIFNFIPIVGTIMVTLYKDVDFVLALLALTFYLYILLCDFKQFNKNKWNYLILLISLVGVGFFRQNGIYISIIIFVILSILSVKNKNKILGIIMVIFLILSIMLKGPLYKILKVKAAPKNFNIATIIHGLDYILMEDKSEYSNETYDYLTSNIMSFNQFKLFYDKYNIDILLHYNSENENKKVRNVKINQKEIIEIYIKQIFKSPIYLLKDRLYGTDIIWNIVEDDKINTLKYQTLYDEFDYNYKKTDIIGPKRNNKTVTNISNYISSNELLNILFFRSGFYLDLLVILSCYQVTKNRLKSLICLLPLLVNILTLFIAMHYQAFRYTWMFSGITILFFFIVIFGNNKSSNN